MARLQAELKKGLQTEKELVKQLVMTLQELTKLATRQELRT